MFKFASLLIAVSLLLPPSALRGENGKKPADSSFPMSSVHSVSYDEPIINEFSIGLRSSLTSYAVLGDLTDKGLSLGAFIEGRRHSRDSPIGLRITSSFDSWGNNNIKGAQNVSSEARRLTASIGLIGFMNKAQHGGNYLCIDLGIAYWDIKSAYALLNSYSKYQFAAAFATGWDVTQHMFLELGIDYSFHGKIFLEEHPTDSKRGGGSLVFAAGWRF